MEKAGSPRPFVGQRTDPKAPAGYSERLTGVPPTGIATMSYFVIAFLPLISVALLVSWAGNWRRNGEVIGSELSSGPDGNRRGRGR